MSGPLGYDYPAGAEHDPRAPYNHREPEGCEKCEGDGVIVCPECGGEGACDDCCEKGTVTCTLCDGTGHEHQPSREEIAIEKADRARDEAKDERE